jgi:hypothetical protein
MENKDVKDKFVYFDETKRIIEHEKDAKNPMDSSSIYLPEMIAVCISCFMPCATVCNAKSHAW